MITNSQAENLISNGYSVDAANAMMLYANEGIDPTQSGFSGPMADELRVIAQYVSSGMPIRDSIRAARGYQRENSAVVLIPQTKVRGQTKVDLRALAKGKKPASPRRRVAPAPALAQPQGSGRPAATASALVVHAKEESDFPWVWVVVAIVLFLIVKGRYA